MINKIILLLCILLLSVISVTAWNDELIIPIINNYYLINDSNSSSSNFNYSQYFDQTLNISDSPMFEGVTISPNGVIGTMSLSLNTISSAFFSYIQINDDLKIVDNYGIILNGTTVYDWSEITGTPYVYNYSQYFDQELNTTSDVNFTSLNVKKTGNSLLSVETDSNNDAFFQLMESDVNCGTTGASGFRNTFDGGTNLYKLSRCSGTTISDIFNVQLSNGYIGFGTTAPTDPVTFNNVVRFVAQTKHYSGTTSAPTIQHRADENTGINFPSTNDQVDIVTNGASMISVTTKNSLNAETIMNKQRFLYSIKDLGKNEESPKVDTSNVYYTANTVTTNIGDFASASASQHLIIICKDSYTTILDNVNLSLNGNFSCYDNDTISLIYYDRWYEISRSDN